MNSNFRIANKNLWKIVVISTVIIFACILISKFLYSSFYLKDYEDKVTRFEEVVENTIYVTEIKHKTDAIAAAEEVWYNSSNTDKYVYSVSYDKKNDCWLIVGRSIDYYNPIYWIGGLTGGVNYAIIQSDGRVLAIWYDM